MFRKFIISFLSVCIFATPLCADEHLYFLQTTPRNCYNLEACAQTILFFYGIDAKNDFQKPIYLAEVSDPKWERAIPFIVAGALLLPFAPTRRLGIALISMGLEFLGWEYYNYVWDYLEDHGIHVDRTLINKPEN